MPKYSNIFKQIKKTKKKALSSRCSFRSNGPNAWLNSGRLHCQYIGCFCNALKRYKCKC